jgi:hypothetical protein
MKRRLFTVAAVCVTLLAMGCRSSAPTYYINPNVDFSYIKKVAVLPFDNLTGTKGVEDVLRHIVIHELLVSGLMEVVVPGEAIGAMEALGIKSVSTLTEDQIKALGKRLDVQGIIIGAIEKYSIEMKGSVGVPEVTLTMMMAETTSGSIVWSVTKTGGGASFVARHFGGSTDTLSEVALDVVREAIDTLFSY